MNRFPLGWWLPACILAAVSWGGRAEPPPPPGSLGGVTVDARGRALEMSGWVNLQQGPVEFLICGPRGKLHESVFVAEGEVTDLHAAFLLLGGKPGKGPTDLGVGQPEGPACVIWVEWEQAGERRRERAEWFVLNLETQEPMAEALWIFTGSIMREGRYMATLDQSFVATYWDPWAVLNLALPLGARDDVLAVRQEVVPPQGTPVRLRFEWIEKAPAEPDRGS